MTAEPTNPRAVIGANSPPTDLDVTVAAHKTHFDDLYTETGNWADGAAIETEAQAAQVDRLLDLWREAIDGATKAQDGLTRPLNEEIATIRSGFSGLIGDTTKIKGLGIRARDVLRQVKTAWGNKVRADQAAEAERLRKVASEQAAQAREALSDAIGNLSATETAEELIQSAQATLKAAKQVERAGAGKGYRTEWRVEITDSRDSIRTMWALHPGEFIALTTQLAERDVRTNGHRSLAGFRIWEEKVAK